MTSFDLSTTFNPTPEESLNIHVLTDSQVFSFIHELSSQTSDVSPKILFSSQQKKKVQDCGYFPRSIKVNNPCEPDHKNFTGIQELLSKQQVYQSFELGENQQSLLIEDHDFTDFSSIASRNPSVLNKQTYNTSQKIPVHFTISRHFQVQQQVPLSKSNSVKHFERQLQLLKSNIGHLKSVIDRISTEGEDQGQEEEEAEITIPNITSQQNTESKQKNQLFFWEGSIGQIKKKVLEAVSTQSADLLMTPQKEPHISQFKGYITGHQLDQLSPIVLNRTRDFEFNTQENSSRGVMEKKMRKRREHSNTV